MHLPRSAPLVGGLTLALMTMPVIVIAGRNAIKSVPPSIRDAALGIGASRVQVVFHHVLPLALPASSPAPLSAWQERWARRRRC
jgi:phosphate transport system permease protein